MTACIVGGCPREATCVALDTTLVDYCDTHRDEWLMAERTVSDDRADFAQDWADDARLERERAYDAGPA